jgi:AcrR family transcriptional regulator
MTASAWRREVDHVNMVWHRPRVARPYHHGDLRAALVRAATALLARDGPDGVTLRGAARRAGVSQAAPYRHFRDKEALLAAVAAEGFRGVVRAGEAVPRRGDPLVTLRRLAQAYVRYATEHPSHYRLMFSPAVRGRTHPSLRDAAGDAWVRFTAAIERGQRAGRVRAGDPTALAFVLWSLLHGLAMLLVDEQLPRPVARLPVDVVVEHATGVLVGGMGAVPARTGTRRARAKPRTRAR